MYLFSCRFDLSQICVSFKRSNYNQKIQKNLFRTYSNKQQNLIELRTE